jgi:glucose-6-phosphate 1-dehydrogenase
MSRRIRTSRLHVAMRFEIDNWRWAGVPFYVRTGKHMAQRTTEIAIGFKPVPYSAFQDTPVDSLRPNWLVLGIAPSAGISPQFEVKRPGSVLDLAAVKMVSATMVPQGAERRIRDADP